MPDSVSKMPDSVSKMPDSASKMPESPQPTAAHASQAASRRYHGLPQEAVQEIAAFFGVSLAKEAFGPDPTMPLYVVEHRGPNGNLSLRCWPRLNRLDISCGPHAWIARDIAELEVITGMEMIFRTKGGALLTVSAEGDVLLSSR